jgi:hypothetical protein
MADEPTVWTQRDAAREYTRLARECDALFAALGALAPRLEPDAAANAAAWLARRLGDHATAWAALVPESVLLADARDAAPDVAAIDPDVASVLPRLQRLRDDLAEILTRTTEVADAAARREARATGADVDEAIDAVRLATKAAAG